jgi:hypothetical protein
MPEPFISSDRRADLFTDLTSRAIGTDAISKKPFDKKDADFYPDDLGEASFGPEEVTGDRIDEPVAKVTVGQRWVKPAGLLEGQPVV